MAVTESDPMFLNFTNAEGEVKNWHYIAKKLEDCIKEAGPQNVIQNITGNASACKVAGTIVESKYSHILWTPCVVHTLNLALKNIFTDKNMEANVVAYAQYSRITEVSNDVWIMKNFIMNHFIRLVIFNDYSKMKLLAVAETRFASWIIMSKKFKIIKRNLQDLIFSDRWNMYRDDDVRQAQFVKKKVINDLW